MGIPGSGAAADLAQTQKELDSLQVAVAAVKATMVLQSFRCSRYRGCWTYMPTKKRHSRGNSRTWARRSTNSRKAGKNKSNRKIP